MDSLEISKDFNLMVGLRIREIRESMQLTREQFSCRCDVSESFLTAIERGEKAITSKTIYKICKGANISADYIIFGRNNNFETDAFLEIYNNLDETAKTPALKILSAYAEALSTKEK